MSRSYRAFHHESRTFSKASLWLNNRYRRSAARTYPSPQSPINKTHKIPDLLASGLCRKYAQTAGLAHRQSAKAGLSTFFGCNFALTNTQGLFTIRHRNQSHHKRGGSLLLV